MSREPERPVIPVVTDPDQPGWRRPPPSSAELRGDLALAAAVFFAAVLVSALYRGLGVYSDPAGGVVTVLGLAGETLPLALRRRYPAAVAVVVAVMFALNLLWQVPEQVVGNIALFGALYAVGAWEPNRRTALVSRVVVVGGLAVWLFVVLYQASVAPHDELGLGGPGAAGPFSPYVSFALLQIVINVMFFAGAWWFGEHAWAAARDRAREALRTDELRRERARAAAQAVTIERIRLARELHDVVAHHVSLMGVAAAAARTQVARDPVRAAVSLEQVEQGAREALDELHGLLRTLRDEGEDLDPGTPAAGLTLARMPELVAESEAAGVPTRLVEVGEPGVLPPTVEVNLVRIAQEALTNVRKHAGHGARAEVRVRWLAGEVELEVSDDGRGPGPAPGRDHRGGLGLIGMRERVAADGGVLEVGRRRGGGFLVRVTVPRVTAGAEVGA